MYAHHHGVKKNDGKDGGYTQFKQRDLGEESIASVLRAAGYRTGIFGKFMNGAAEKGGIAGGWDQWTVAVDRNYYKPVMNDNGKTREYQKKNQYSTDILAGRARDFLKKTSSGTPFLLWFTPRAPHGKLQPRRKDRGKYGGTWRERSPDVLEEDASDKPNDIRQRKPMSLGAMDKMERKRLDLLAATDEAVAAILAELKSDGRLANTVVLVLSDNGYMLGSHRCDAKGFPYRGATQVTMLASGPPFAAGVTDERVTGNIDIAPTIAALAGVSLPDADGVPIFDRTKNSAMLVENFGSSGRAYAGLRTTDYLYVENGSGERELYDYRVDPFELDNLLADWNGHTPSADAKATAANLRALLQPLLDCAGATCR
jgi:arylsulfatase A-like enzyme